VSCRWFLLGFLGFLLGMSSSGALFDDTSAGCGVQLHTLAQPNVANPKSPVLFCIQAGRNENVFHVNVQ
jgi:hypothetical protein